MTLHTLKDGFYKALKNCKDDAEKQKVRNSIRTELAKYGVQQIARLDRKDYDIFYQFLKSFY